MSGPGPPCWDAHSPNKPWWRGGGGCQNWKQRRVSDQGGSLLRAEPAEAVFMERKNRGASGAGELLLWPRPGLP